MSHLDPLLGAGMISSLQRFVTETKLHPVLVNFTAALVPVSVVSDLAGRFLKNESLRQTAWWTLVYAVLVTPFTAFTGWLFWMPGDNDASGMVIHKWLGTALGVLLVAVFAWRWHFHRRQQSPTWAYFMVAGAFVLALAYQGHLGGEQVFSGM
jgi:uncharacterized membrane protein